MTGPGRRRTTLPTTQDDTQNEPLSPLDYDESPISTTANTDWGSPPRHQHHDSASNIDGLHHRNVRRTSVDQERGYVGRTRISSKKRKPKKFPWIRWLRTCVLAGIPAYLLLIFIFLKRMNHQHELQLNGPERFVDSRDIAYIRDVHAIVKKDLKTRQLHDEEEWGNAVAYEKRTAVLSMKRRQRTRPPATVDAAVPVPVISILSPTQHERPPTRYEPQPEDDRPAAGLIRPSTLDEICGYQAQNAALLLQQNNNKNAANNNYFPVRDSLTMPRSRVVRVLITGILSQPAYLLALALKERCGVQVIIGFDAMYPNSIRNRLRLQEQMAVLTKFLPKLVRPIFLAYLGLDPLRHSRNFKTLEGTGEVDLLQSFNPTHIVHMGSYDPAVFRYSDPDFKNLQSPYVRNNIDGDEQEQQQQNVYSSPPLYSLRSGMLSIEQILASIAAAPPKNRPHLLYASSSSGSAAAGGGGGSTHSWARRIDEVLADYYYQTHGVYSVGLRFPNAIYGQWGHPESDLYKIFDQAANFTTASSDLNHHIAASDTDKLDLLHVDDIVDGVISAMQYRPENSKPVIFEFSSGTALSLRQVQDAAQQILDTDKVDVDIVPRDTKGPDYEANMEKLKRSLGWTPRISLKEGLTRTLAWHLDRLHPYGPPLHDYKNSKNVPPPPPETGDMLLMRHSIPTCAADDIVCHGSRPVLPCASECAVHDQCVPTVFDALVPMVQDLTEECDIVLYTQNFDTDASDLELQSEFMDDGNPLVCNFAFIASESKLVETVIAKVPDSELSKLGFELTPEDARNPGGIKERKNEKLNGRLLYRGWILIWTKDTPEEMPTHEKFLLKLSPGRLFHQDVKAAVFIDQGFGVSPTADDIQFLVHEMDREPWNSRVVKRKTRPKAKFLLPAEPRRRAVVLMSELKYVDSSKSKPLSPDEKISTYEATRFMRFSNGEEPLGKEPPGIKLQREFYDRLRTTINPDHARGPGEPQHKFELTHWARSRWVAHDLAHEESRQLRCEWYQEHALWGNELDQLSFAYVMAKLELNRKLAHHEPDDVVQKHLSEKTEMKKLLSDTFEWHSLITEQNKLYCPYEEMQVLPYDMDYTEERELVLSTTPVDNPDEGSLTPLYVRVISDRIMSYARKAWNNEKAVDGMKSEL